MMKIELLLLCYWFAVPQGRCSEQTPSSHHDKQLVIDSNEVESQSSSSSQIPEVVPSVPVLMCPDPPSVSPVGTVAPQTPALLKASAQTRVMLQNTWHSTRHFPGTEGGDIHTPPNRIRSFPAVQENASIRETRKPAKDQTGKRSNASLVLKDQASADSDPSVPSRDQEIPTFDEWTKIMMETEKSQVTPHAPDGKKLQQTITNYASVECGAKILSSNPEAKSTSAVLMENMDMYMLNPCNNKIWFIIELCQPIQVKQLDIANFEIFSSNPKDFLVSISDRYPNKKWVKLGTFHARDERTVQSFPLDEHLFAKFVKMFTRYIKVELLSHFGSEHFCPLSLIRVFGTSMMEEYELNSEPSDRQAHSHDEQDYDQPPDFVPVDDKSSANLIGSAKDALLTMVNNIAANVLGGQPESTGNSSTEGLNASEVDPPLRSGVMHSGPVADQLDVAGIAETASISSTTHTDAPRTEYSPVPAEPDAEQIVTLLPEAEDEPDQSSGPELGQTDQQDGGERANESRGLTLHEYLLQRCFSLQERKNSRSHSASAVITSSMSTITEHTESPVIHTHILPAPDAPSELQSVVWDLAPSLTSDVLVSTDRPSVELTSVSECLTATIPPQSIESGENPDPATLSDLVTSSTGDHEMISATSRLDNNISTPTVSISTVDESLVTLTPAEAAHPSDGFLESAEARTKELLEDESSANMELDGEPLGSSEAPAHGSSQKESVFMRLNNRIKALEMNMSLSGRYLEQLSQRYRKQVEEMQRAFNKTIIKLQNTSRTAEEQDQRQTDSIQVLQAQLENVTHLVLSLSVSVSRLQQEVSDRQSYILLCLILCVLLALLICVNYRQMCESPALDMHRSCCPERELLSDEEPVIPRRRASDPPSLSSLQTPEGVQKKPAALSSGNSVQLKKHKLKLSRSLEDRAAPPAAAVIPQSTIGPQALEVRDVMSDGSEGSSHSDETLFCGFTSCARLCETIPAPGRWTQSKRQKTPEQLHQPPQRSIPYNLTRTRPTEPPGTDQHWIH